jgi:hypothetical protein
LAINALRCVARFVLAEWPRDDSQVASMSSGVASPFVVFERDEVSSVVGSLLLFEASEAATAARSARHS